MDCGNLMKSIRNVILNVCRERHQSLSKNFFQRPIDKSVKMWYNIIKIREGKLLKTREGNIMTAIEVMKKFEKFVARLVALNVMSYAINEATGEVALYVNGTLYDNYGLFSEFDKEISKCGEVRWMVY